MTVPDGASNDGRNTYVHTYIHIRTFKHIHTYMYNIHTDMYACTVPDGASNDERKGPIDARRFRGRIIAFRGRIIAARTFDLFSIERICRSLSHRRFNFNKDESESESESES